MRRGEKVLVWFYNDRVTTNFWVLGVRFNLLCFTLGRLEDGFDFSAAVEPLFCMPEKRKAEKVSFHCRREVTKKV